VSVARTDLEQNLARVRRGIAAACARAGRDASEVTLVAVTKTFPADVVRSAHEAGVRDFGENYAKELGGKAPTVPDAKWHYVGTLQSHTAHTVAEHADCVHGLEPGGAVARLARRAASLDKVLPVLVQVDFAGSRNGVAPDEMLTFADEVASLDGLVLSGLMTLPPMPASPDACRPYFAQLCRMGDDLRRRHPTALQLSMGMSLDYEVAVEEGATMVRVGTALFGERARR